MIGHRYPTLEVEDGIVWTPRLGPWLVLRLPELHYDGLTAHQRVNELRKYEAALSSIGATEAHMLVVEVPAREVPVRGQPSEHWDAYLAETRRWVAEQRYTSRATFLAVRLNRMAVGSMVSFGARLLRAMGGSRETSRAATDRDEYRNEARLVARGVQSSGVPALPATREELARLISRPCWFDVDRYATQPGGVIEGRHWYAARVVHGVAEQHPRRFGLGGARQTLAVAPAIDERWVATLVGTHCAFQPFPDGAWLLPNTSLGFRPEVSIRMELVSAEDEATVLDAAHAATVDQVENITVDGDTSDARVGIGLAEQMATTRELAHEVRRARRPWVWPSINVTVTARTREELADRVKDTRSDFAAVGLTLEWPPADQYRLLMEQVPGTAWRVKDWQRRMPMVTVAGGMPTATVRVGMDEGPYLGHTVWLDRTPVYLDITALPRLNLSPTVAVTGQPGSGKALALDTPIPTPDGWRTMGSLEVGGQVFDEHGRACTIIDATDVMVDRPCYEITFSDGTRVVADADHQWLTSTRNDRVNHGWRQQLVTTKEMAETQRVNRDSRANHAVRLSGPLAYAWDHDLPVAPYTFGAWLGDGSTNAAAITCADPEIIERVVAEGYRIGGVQTKPNTQVRTYQIGIDAFAQDGCGTPRGYAAHRRSGERSCRPCLDAINRQIVTRRDERSAGVPPKRRRTFLGALRDAGVLGDKHIPERYLRAGVQQRRALLAGLLDTDGHASARGGVEFAVTNERLARDVHELVTGLGHRVVALRSRPARLNGRTVGTTWLVAFTTNEVVFGLARKQAAIDAKASAGRGTARTQARYVTSVVEVPSVPVRCISVDSESRLYLATRACIPTHNSATAKKACIVEPRLRGAQVTAFDIAHELDSVLALPGMGRTQVIELDSRFAGALDPAVLHPNDSAEAAALAVDLAMTMLPNVHGTTIEIALTAVADQVFKSAAPSMGAFVKKLKASKEQHIASVGAALDTYSRMSLASLFFGTYTGETIDLADSLTVLRWKGLDLAEAGTPDAEMTSRNRLSSAVLLGTAALVRGLMEQADRNTEKVLVLDEAHQFTSSRAGTAQVRKFSAMSRKVGLTIVLITQNVAHLGGGDQSLLNNISVVLAFRATDPAEQAAVARLLRRGHETPDGVWHGDPEIMARLGRLGAGDDELRSGFCLMRDPFDRVGEVKIDHPVKALWQAVQTTPLGASAPIATEVAF